MKTHSPYRPWARLAAVACAATLATALAASVTLQRSRAVPASAAEVAVTARLDARLAHALEQAYLDGDLDLADSLERIRASRAAARCREIENDAH